MEWLAPTLAIILAVANLAVIGLLVKVMIHTKTFRKGA